ncbi:LysR family transcriptional regulator [Aureimonas populi]|uniref:LysR family transcriptional regulator n=1 Tax=Aureimonas populi TaxID=1701758 RepID=A0ABW5CJQ9_9HYPH|nr:LysR family transcriptional regulator [Aureimonas populi]
METLDAKALKHFLTVVRTGSIRGAAEQLNVAPSAVSRQIADLEHRLGLAVFERTARGVILTEAGGLVLEHAKRVVEDHGLLAEQLDQLKGVQQTRVRVICGEGLVADYIGHGLKAFLALHPAIRHALALGSTEAIIDAVTNGEADIGIVYNPVMDTRIRSLAIRRQPLCLIAPPGHAALRRPHIALAACLKDPCALMTKGHGVRQLVGRVAADCGLALAPVLETPSIDALRQFVASGLGVTFLPRFAVSTEVARGAVGAVELTDRLLSEASAHLIVRAHRRLPPSVERLAGCLAQEMVALRS